MRKPANTLTAVQVMRRLGGLTRGRLTQLENAGLKSLAGQSINQSGGGKLWATADVDKWRETYKVNRRMQRIGKRSRVNKTPRSQRPVGAL